MVVGRPPSTSRAKKPVARRVARLYRSVSRMHPTYPPGPTPGTGNSSSADPPSAGYSYWTNACSSDPSARAGPVSQRV